MIALQMPELMRKYCLQQGSAVFLLSLISKTLSVLQRVYRNCMCYCLFEIILLRN